MPRSMERWLDVKGIMVAALVVSRLRQRPRWSWPAGRQERKPGSISERARREGGARGVGARRPRGLRGEAQLRGLVKAHEPPQPVGVHVAGVLRQGENAH